MDGADVVINLNGKSVDCRYTEKNRRAIIASRVDSTRASRRGHCALLETATHLAERQFGDTLQT